MRAAAVSTCLLLSAGWFWWLSGCGDVAGDAITIAEQSMSLAGSGGEQAGAGGGSDSAGAGPTGSGSLCDPCEQSADCGGPDDRCLINSFTGEQFCGRACSSSDPCPSPFDCLLVESPDGGPRLAQCVPPNESCEGLTGAAGCPTLDELRQYNLQRLNEIRAEHGLAPYVLDDCLNRIAQEANEEHIATGEPNGKFARECWPIVPMCECNWQQESMGHSVSDNRSWQDNFNVVLGLMMSEPGSVEHQNIVSTQWTRVGIGVSCYHDGHEIYFTNDFGP